MNKAQLFLNFTERYRKVLYFLHRHPLTGIMKAGRLCHVEDPTINTTHGDVVHPCIRYIEEGFEGHQWWMVYTPLYGGDDSLENPRLYYSDAKPDELPTDWEFYCVIKDKHEHGYNSDPTMLFMNGKLYVFWRECSTPKAEELGYTNVTLGCCVQNKTITYLTEPIMMEQRTHEDCEVSPTIIDFKGAFRAYAMHVHLTPDFMFRIPGRLAGFIYRHGLFVISEALGIYSPTRSRGVAIWNGNALDKTFTYSKTMKFKNQSRLYQPWHMDIFKANDGNSERIYAIVQSSIKFADICLAVSKDGEQFYFFRKPLLTNISARMNGFYKPTAIVVGNKLYLFYTARDKQDCHLNRLFVTSEDWPTLIQRLNKYGL